MSKKKYLVYALIDCSSYVGEFEAESEEEAIKMAEEKDEGSYSLCHHCSQDLDLGDVTDYIASEA